MRHVMVRAAVRCRADQPIEVRWPLDRPTHVARVAQVLEDWDYVVRWWADEVRRRYRLLEADGGRVVEVFDEGGARWVSRATD